MHALRVCVLCVVAGWENTLRHHSPEIDKYLLEAATTAREPIKLGKIGFESTDRAVPYGVWGDARQYRMEYAMPYVAWWMALT